MALRVFSISGILRASLDLLITIFSSNALYCLFHERLVTFYRDTTSFLKKKGRREPSLRVLLVEPLEGGINTLLTGNKVLDRFLKRWVSGYENGERRGGKNRIHTTKGDPGMPRGLTSGALQPGGGRTADIFNSLHLFFFFLFFLDLAIR